LLIGFGTRNVCWLAPSRSTRIIGVASEYSVPSVTVAELARERAFSKYGTQDPAVEQSAVTATAACA
jgi:hypothetical protein